MRVAALRSLQILDTPRQGCFDRITEFCTELFDCSISLISLIDADRQWFLAASGIDGRETPREISFCSHVIEAGRSLLISDALENDCFRANAMVVGAPGIRSYLGQPIASAEGVLLGTLCVADTRPDHFHEGHIDQLRYFGRIVEDLIEAHRQRMESTQLAAELEERSERLKKSNRVFAQAERVANIGSWELELESGRATYSDESLAILDLSKSQTYSLNTAMELYVPEDRPMLEAALENAVVTRGSSSIEAHVITPLGHRKRIKVVGEYLEASSDTPARLVGILQDVTEAYHSQMALQRAADYDSLTSLLNRQAFDRHLGERLRTQRHSGRDFFVLLLDLDGFKDINDTFGHLVGDVVLEEISSRITAAVPTDALVARWGGDEFAIITPMGISQEDATAVGEKLIRAVSREVEIAGRKVAVSATCGLARSAETIVARELLRRADLALYHGKRREPGCTHHYRVLLERDNRLRQEAIGLVRSALTEDRLFAGYQPIVRLADNAMVGLEALMRLNTRSGDKLTATQVLPAILDPILSREISDRMIDLVSTEFPEIHAAQPDVQYVSLNATEADLLSRDFSDRLLSRLRGQKIDPRNVTLEITETMFLVNDAASVQSVLSKLRNSRMQIALDDFGTGFSSLSHLRDFPIDKVKIDGSFVQKMCTDHQSRLIVQALIAMAKNLGKEVIAEGIETDDQRKLLLQMGCYYGQGFLFSPAENACRLKLMQLSSGAPKGRRKAA
ncbi:putative bifunctional diguanylate cyclase/phosphodiesterase [Novosphingobium tardum]|uniref:Bifunctional diguanylate cyclase/phosphodiesterase n=1 Tax=Novosphingobium tardum TaxID=1538021 RepID=A0ABV8RJ75_9SPHN